MITELTLTVPRLVLAVLVGALAEAATPAQPAELDRDAVSRQFVETDELILLAAEHAAGLQPDGLPPGWMIIEEDIQVPLDFFNQRATFDTNLWDQGTVPFEFASDVTPEHRNLAMDAMDLWEDGADLTFRARQALDVSFLHFHNSTNGNNSPVGPQIGGNTINVEDWNLFTIVHEVGHSLGYWHEQSRPDRLSFIDIIEANIESGREHNFEPRGAGYGPYDFDSIMHYGSCAFSCCRLSPNTCHPNNDCDDSECFTIVTLDPNEQANIGQRDHLSEWDRKVMSLLYPPSNWRFVDTTYSGFFENGTFVEPWKTVQRGLDEAPAGGRLVIMKPTTYTERTIYDTMLTISAPLGGVVLR